MGLFRKNRTETRQLFPYISEVFGSGVFSAEHNPSVDRVVSKIANSVSILPIKLYTHTKNGRMEAFWNPVSKLLKDPSVEESPVLFWKTLVRQILLTGNGYIFKHSDGNEVLSLELIDPSRVTVKRSPIGRKLFYVSGTRGGQFTDDDIIHIPYTGEGYNGTTGKSPCEVHSNIIRQNDIISEYISIFFNNSVGSRIILELGDKFEPGSQKLEKLMQELRQYFQAFVTGAQNAGKPMIAPPNTTMKLMEQSSNVQSDTQAIYKASCNQIYGIFNVPPEVLDSSQSKYNSLEQKNQDFLTDALRPLTLHIAECLKKGLVNPEDTNLFLEWDYTALIETDRQKAMDFYGGAFQKGILSLNEARAKLSLPPVDNDIVGNTLWIQSSMIPNTEDNINSILAKSKLALKEAETTAEKNEDKMNDHNGTMKDSLV